MSEVTATGATVYMVCADCVPAGGESVRLDDYRGNCQGCGVRDGNLRRIEVLPLVAKRGWWALGDGSIRGPRRAEASL